MATARIIDLDLAREAHDIHALHAQQLADLKMTLERAVEIGKRLHAVKAALPHGQFMPWVEANCGFKRSQCNAYMAAAKLPLAGNSPPPKTVREAAAQGATKQAKPVPRTENIRPEQVETVPEKDKARFDRLVNKKYDELLRKFHTRLEEEKEKCRNEIYATLEPERERLNAERETLEEARKNLDDLMTEEEFMLVRGCLHPDKHSGTEQERYARAFALFNALKRWVNKHLPAAELRKRGWPDWRDVKRRTR